MCPNVSCPTGTEIGAPVSVTSAPLLKPSVPCIEIALTLPSPRCCATSKTIVLVFPSISTSTSRANVISGNSSCGKATSTTGPAIFTTLPIFSLI